MASAEDEVFRKQEIFHFEEHLFLSEALYGGALHLLPVP